MTTFSAAHVRRAGLAAAPLLAGIGCLVGSLADPSPTSTGLDLVQVYTDNWDAVQLKSSAYHYGYMFMGATALGVAALVRSGRGVALALIAGALAVFGISTLPGMLIADFYASAGGQQIGAEAMHEIEKASQSGWGAGAIVAPGMLGFLLSFPLALFAATRAGLLRWHAPALGIAGMASFTAFTAQPIGNALMALCFALLGLCILRAPITAFGGRTPVAVEEEQDEPAAEFDVAASLGRAARAQQPA